MAADRLCPSCGDLIAADAPGCRRCGYDTTAGPAPGPSAPPQAHPHVPPANASPYSAAYAQARVFHNPADDKTPWQEVAFKVMAVVILVLGALDVLTGVILLSKSGGASGGVSIAYGSVSILIGIGLLAEWDFASIVLKVYCWLSILGFIGVFLFFLAMAMSGFAIGWLGVLVVSAFIAVYGFMLYLVNEVGQA